MNDAQVNMFDEIRRLCMELIYNEGGLDDFETIVEIEKNLVGLKLRMDDLKKERDMYLRKEVNTKLENDRLKKELEILRIKEPE